MKCYYEELGIARDASDGDIKTAYRKLALRWHPDKNMDNLEEAKEKFQVLQQAYEVLSDHHERAWYDNHREQILRGKNSEYQENCLDLFQYFTVSCFKGYGDDDKGFYKTYAEVFNKIAAEDAEFMDDEEEVESIPKFGDSTSSYEDVVGPFYAYWQSYCTKKTYTWLCPHDITAIKDRRILRHIEKDMKKIVQQAKRERNEEVRNLVSFIRKRDKRVQANKKILEERAALNRQKQEQNRLEQIRKRNRELEEMRKNANVFNDGFEEQLKQLEQEYDNDSDSEEESDELGSDEEMEDEFLDDLYCVACNKAFTNEKAFINHETSKKHKENTERLVKELKEEENVKQKKKINIVELEDLDDYDCDYDDLSDTADLPSDLEDLDEELLSRELDDELEDLEIEEQEPEDYEELEEKEEPIVIATSKKNKKHKKSQKAPQVDQEDFDGGESPDSLEAKIEDNLKETDDSDDDWGNASKKNTKKLKNKKPQKKNTPNTETVDLQPVIAKEPIATPKQESSSFDTAHNCVTCKASFPSKNKLFAHLKKTNHGVYIPKSKPQETAQQQTNKKSKGRKK